MRSSLTCSDTRSLCMSGPSSIFHGGYIWLCIGQENWIYDFFMPNEFFGRISTCTVEYGPEELRYILKFGWNILWKGIISARLSSKIHKSYHNPIWILMHASCMLHAAAKDIIRLSWNIIIEVCKKFFPRLSVQNTLHWTSARPGQGPCWKNTW